MDKIFHTGKDYSTHVKSDVIWYMQHISLIITVNVVVILLIYYLFFTNHFNTGHLKLNYTTDVDEIVVTTNVDLKNNFKFDLPHLTYKHKITIEGHIKPRYSENYTFIIPNVFNSTILTVDGIQIMDVTSSKVSPSIEISLTKDVWVPIKIEQTIDDLDPNHLEFELNWKSKNEKNLNIPSSRIKL